jgi:diguanylate cyclase (GGDEF)-like protein
MTEKAKNDRSKEIDPGDTVGNLREHLAGISGRVTARIPDRSAARGMLERLAASVSQFLKRRSLLGEILILQLTFAFIVGILAFGALWLASNWVVRDNMHNWGEQWLATLDELGMPLYVSDNEDRFLRVEDYVKKFPEISFVRFYSNEGDLVFEDHPRPVDAEATLLGKAELRALTVATDKERPYLLDATDSSSQLMRIGKPIWTESLMQDGLLGLDLSDESSVQRTLVGYVELGLNAGRYKAELNRVIKMGTILGVIVLLLLTGASWFIYRQALLPLSQLQKPLRKLAMGRTDFQVKTSGHTEIVAIADALNTTVSALNERDKELWNLANHDQLTGLINRHRFAELLDDELEKLASGKSSSALLFIDLDQFKYVNDTVGHAAGDRLLQDAADRLKSGLRRTDVIGRFGGDEFIVLLRDVDRPEVELICGNLIKSLGDHRFVENDESFSIRCSIGITMINGDGLTPAELMSQADMACHHAKSQGRNRYDFFREARADKEGMASEIGWSRQIHEALEEDKFIVHFQPIFDIETHEPALFEVLLRMPDGAGNLIPPDAFMPAAERFSLMADIDRWVIRHALKRLAEFRETRPGTCFTLNVSGPMFEKEDFGSFLQENLKENGLTLDEIVLEITEQVAVRTAGTAGKQINELAELGCKFALDDFGAGYSSYSYLKTLPVDFIKIDGAFIANIVDDIVDQKIVGSIIEIARATGKQTIAEHVADYETFDLLRELGVDFAQGYFVGEPTDTLTVKVVPESLDAVRKRRAKLPN